MELNNSNSKLLQSLGIKLESLDKDKVVMTMPVDERTKQPYGYLHGGASVLLAETVASIGGALHVDLEKQAVFGMEINANHLRSKREGTVTAVGRPIHLGRRSMVWSVELFDEEKRLICISRCTLGITDRERH
mgnify:CR=1 FL=1